MRTHHDVFCFVMDMPYDIHGCTRPNVDGSYSVYLNANDNYETQESAKEHELKHIEGGDYDGAGCLVDLMDAIEWERHG